MKEKEKLRSVSDSTASSRVRFNLIKEVSQPIKKSCATRTDLTDDTFTS